MNLPILLLANYRTGSSALVRILGRKYGLDVYSEPHLYPTQLTELVTRLHQKENNFIIKFMPDYIDKVKAYKFIYNSDCYKIKLTRQDKVDQVLSYYLAKMTEVWNDIDGISGRPELYTVSIDDSMIDLAIRQIYNCDKLLDESNAMFDENLIYEDLDLHDIHITKLNAPSNYKELYSYIKIKILQKSHIIT